ncbi:MAG: hypothetical protein J4473_00710 [Candidatus Aenigmarchaeota archaeon]|nr:hypothetical protein [Candidatus Aenigmarchaeota archaeon]
MKTMSKMESVVLDHKKRTVSVLDVIGMFVCTKNEASVILHRMAKKGLLIRVKKGVYTKPEENSISVFSEVIKKYYFSFITALNFHGLTDQVPMIQIAATTEEYGRFLDIQMIKISEKKFFGFKCVEFQGAKIFMADRERALLDSLEKPKYAGGIRHVIGCFKNKYYTEKLINYAFRINNMSLIRRLGYVLEYNKIKIPSHSERQMLIKVKKVSFYTKLNISSESVFKNKKWMVVNDVR